MMKYVVRMLAVIGAVTLLSSLVATLSLFRGGGKVERGTWLEIDFSRRIAEHAPAVGLLELAVPPGVTTRDVIDALERAGTDDRIEGVVARLGGVGMGFGQIQEVRAAILDLREAGKRTIAYADTFGEFGSGTWTYYLASAFESVRLQPSGDVGITGLIAQTPFMRDALDKLRVRPRLDARSEYKSAVNVYTKRGYTEAHREATGAVLAGQFEQIVSGIAAARDLEPGAVRRLVDRAPLAASEALEAGLVDSLAYGDEVWDELKTPAGDDPPRLRVKPYLALAGRPNASGERVALIYGVGPIHRGHSGVGSFSGEPTMGADTVVAAFRSAVADDSVRAILFRVDSPGGSYIASDTVWREVGRARRHGKPVVVSMGNVAGSGGYFVAMNADRIVAQPGTITGSIGVLAGKLVTTDFWQRLGVNWDEIHEGRNAAMWSPIRDYTEPQWEQFQGFLDRIYGDFTAKVAEGRGLEPAVVARLARGRIWTGEDAMERGLVDVLGGMETALAEIRTLLALPADGEIELREFPRPKTLAEQLAARLSGDEEDVPFGVGGQLAAVVRRLRAAPGTASLLQLLDADGPLLVPHPIAYRGWE